MPARTDCSHFIPVHTPELVQLFCSDRSLPEQDRSALAELAERTQQAYHREFHSRLVELKNAYAPFDPDSDAAPVVPISAAQKQQRLNDLLSDLIWLLNRANYRHLSREEIEPMLADSSDWGIRMQVDFSAFEHCAIFVRGESYEMRTLRSWRTLFQEQEVEVPIFRRLVLILKLRPNPRLGPAVEPDDVYLKVFKDMPRADVDMLLPGAKVRMKLFDRGKIGVGLMSGLGTMVWKLFDDLWRFAQDMLLSGSAVMRASAIWGLTAGTLGYGYKSYYDYRTTQQAYHLNLTQSLYFQCLDSNAGVLTRLFDEAEEQETRTTLLAYYCLWRYSGPEGFTTEELEAAMEIFLDRYTGVTLLCQTGEPANRLVRLGLARFEGLRVRPLPPREAIEILRSRRELPLSRFSMQSPSRV